MTYKFIKKFRRDSVKVNKGPNIPLSAWEKKLTDACSEPPLIKMAETDNCPTVTQIKRFLNDTKNGTAPGIDEGNVDLLKNAPDWLIDELTELLEEIWLYDEVPKIWLETNQKGFLIM